ncbi:hypothetical protein, partial [Cupriavidus metallidurans]|uniref:hypothetical protein n=1 Tax=Cupriavidus metallidurans TaxID=119219 RepID=UPI001BE0822C
QYGHVDHSELPLVPKRASVLYVGQHSMQIPAVGGSGFSANQQPSHLKVLHERLPEATRRHAFGPIHAWWMLDVNGRLVELAGESEPVAPAWDAFPVPAEVVTALQRAAMPVQVLTWLKKARLNLTATTFRNGQLAEIEPLVHRAMDYGLAGMGDVATFVVYGLRYKVDYEQHPHLQALLTGAAAQRRPLAQAFRDVDPDVWHELAETAQQRVEARMVSARHVEMKKTGYLRLRARVVNDTGGVIGGVFFDLSVHPDRQYIGNIDGRTYGETVLDKVALLSPLPGDKLTLFWDESHSYAPGRYMRTPRKLEFIVKGELPNDENSGLLEIRFTKYGQSVVMHKDAAVFNHTKGQR